MTPDFLGEFCQNILAIDTAIKKTYLARATHLVCLVMVLLVLMIIVVMIEMHW